jgi:hypothetical protein
MRTPALVRWTDEVAFYALTYGSLGDPVQIVEKLIGP